MYYIRKAKRIVNLGLRVKANEPSLFGIWEGLHLDTIVVIIQDFISPKTLRFKQSLFDVIEAGGIHQHLKFNGRIILALIGKDELLYKLPLSKVAAVLKHLKPNNCTTVDGGVYEDEAYWHGGTLYYNRREISDNELTRCREQTKLLVKKFPDIAFIGLVKGRNRSQILAYTKFLRNLGINKMMFHAGEYFRFGSPQDIATAKNYASLIRPFAEELILYGIGAQKRLLEFSFADTYITHAHIVNALNGKILLENKIEKYAGGYSKEIIIHNITQILANIKLVSTQQKLIIGGECPWVEAEVLVDLYTDLEQALAATIQQ